MTVHIETQRAIRIAHGLQEGNEIINILNSVGTGTGSGSSGQVSAIYPKTDYTWTDRTGVTTPDYTGGSFNLSTLTQVTTSNAGTLIITADSTAAGAILGVAIVLWDERGNPISISNGQITTSSWAKNAAGNYVASQGYSVVPGYLAFDVSNASNYSIMVIQVSAGTVNLHSKLF